MKKQRLPIIRATRPTSVGAAFGIACGSKALMSWPEAIVVRLEFSWSMNYA